MERILDLYNEKLGVLQARMAETRIALESESKSSAGDKHETGRAMIQLEQEKLGAQVVQLEKEISDLGRLNIQGPFNEIRLGALVRTSAMSVFLGPGLGPMHYKDQMIACISRSAPLAQSLLGKKLNDKAEFNGKEFHILSIE
jgi:hypothetical protein